MELETLNKNLRRACLINGMCQASFNEWVLDKSYQELIDTMKDDPLFIYRVPYIRSKMISKYVDHSILINNDIYTDKDYFDAINTNCIFLFGNANGNIFLSEGKYRFYLYENSSLTLNVSNTCEVRLYLCEKSECTINTSNIITRPRIELLSKKCTINGNNSDLVIFERFNFQNYVDKNYKFQIKEIL